MRVVCFLLLVLSGSSTLAYEEGWGVQNFYEEVVWCKKSIVLPSGQDFIKAGLKKGKDERALVEKSVAMTPVFEKIATPMCYCTFNELAKDVKYSEYERNESVKNYMEIPRCKKLMEGALRKFLGSSKSFAADILK